MNAIGKISLYVAFMAATLTGRSDISPARDEAPRPDTLTFAQMITPVDEPDVTETKSEVDQFISDLYKSIRFGGNRLSFGVFSEAMHGFINLKNAGKLGKEKSILSICDFNLASTQERLWVIDLAKKKVLFNTLVAHGEGSGKKYARKFSNVDESHQSSPGFYVTRETYQGKHGTSLRMDGLDKGFNDNAFDRAIVVHGANYVSRAYIKKKGYLGQSWGCPAVPASQAKRIINVIKDSTCLFIAYKDPKYLASSEWLKKKSTVLPDEMRAIAVAKPAVVAPKTAR